MLDANGPVVRPSIFDPFPNETTATDIRLEFIRMYQTGSLDFHQHLDILLRATIREACRPLLKTLSDIQLMMDPKPFIVPKDQEPVI